MMRSKVYNTLLLCFLAATVFAQNRLSGTVSAKEDSHAIKDCIVYLNGVEKSSVTDNRGKFLFEDLPNGNYTLHFTSPEFKYHKTEVAISNADETIRIALELRTETLDEVMITDASSNFGLT